MNKWLDILLHFLCLPLRPRLSTHRAMEHMLHAPKRKALCYIGSLHVVHSCDISSFLDTNKSYSFVCFSLFARTRASCDVFAIKQTFRLAILCSSFMLSIHSPAFISFSFVSWTDCEKLCVLNSGSKNRNAYISESTKWRATKWFSCCRKIWLVREQLE